MSEKPRNSVDKHGNGKESSSVGDSEDNRESDNGPSRLDLLKYYEERAGNLVVEPEYVFQDVVLFPETDYERLSTERLKSSLARRSRRS